ncbi:uncharacterized transporter slc-17.2-like [Biomphalaria glabrata]|uniref:Uncharacterized transporter slc-17.2-like n=1 Tax=Biomphalaria glabrata TaxID=6526 RepID=A0A9W2YYZ5_BIOGL|nr:uncharacterized transporter slc-17.2-like [Biomphalaria glabrata]XP_055867861.1 uncharacterized transporter slc-17.2-like [Biomphalaria glabrata]XP_055867863.1 uncharacterized transporter slc-17.2-like [Biomphalaria glabrata]XP_055867864.1 uncharacterized transporter slc-17.2-like [Biomphalaria glabrata]XP_055867865.1 uncharacterized transporter slc-17.2-like [Biomphalaria glabrata]XP_055867866.1 uncharacterized transporter slc-17.2-like [Biomphalaria glabrata]XP_055867867.1 uncharacterize
MIQDVKLNDVTVSKQDVQMNDVPASKQDVQMNDVPASKKDVQMNDVPASKKDVQMNDVPASKQDVQMNDVTVLKQDVNINGVSTLKALNAQENDTTTPQTRKQMDSGQDDIAGELPKSLDSRNRLVQFCQKLLSWRGCIALLLHTSIVVNVMAKNNLFMAVVCMTNTQTINISTNGSMLLEVDHTNYSSPVLTPLHEFDWSPQVQGLLLTGTQFVLFLGPLMSNVIVHLIGGKWSLTVTTSAVVVLSSLSPIAARTDPYLFLAVRILTGLTFGVTPTVMAEALNWWSPETEKLTWVAFTYTGFNVGGIVGSSVFGALCTVSLDNGWPFIFYFTAAVNLIWLPVWHFLFSVKPEQHPYVSTKEKNYIYAHRADLATSSTTKVKTPYRKMLTSLPVLSYLLTSSCHAWVSIVMFTFLPLYLTRGLQFTADKSGVLISAILVAQFVGTFMWTGASSWMMTRPSMTTSKVRKICIVLGLTCACVTNLSLAFIAAEYKYLAIAVLVVSVIFLAVGFSSISMLPLDMAPRFAGQLTSFNFSLLMLVSISGPLVVSRMAPNSTVEEWRNVWILIGLVSVFAAIVFAVFGQGAVQPWAESNAEALPDPSQPREHIDSRRNSHETPSLGQEKSSTKPDLHISSSVVQMKDQLQQDTTSTHVFNGSTFKHAPKSDVTCNSSVHDLDLGADNLGFLQDNISDTHVVNDKKCVAGINHR